MNQKHAIKEQSRDHEKKSKDVNTQIGNRIYIYDSNWLYSAFTRFPLKCKANTLNKKAMRLQQSN